MIDVLADPVAWVEARRATLTPVRFGVLVALARRAAAREGDARRRLVARLETLASAALAGGAAAPAAVSPSAGLLALAQLVDRLDRPHLPPAAGPTPTSGAPAVYGARGVPARSRTALPKPLKSVVAFQGTWSRLRVDQRLRQALAQVPAQAGPLNSAHLVNRALQALHGLSPAYLDAFMAHVDALQWLAQATGEGAAPPRVEAAPAARKTPSRPARKR